MWLDRSMPGSVRWSLPPASEGQNREHNQGGGRLFEVHALVRSEVVGIPGPGPVRRIANPSYTRPRTDWQSCLA
jgi:hypothetical protein